jgi:hypothetical protein
MPNGRPHARDLDLPSTTTVLQSEVYALAMGYALVIDDERRLETKQSDGVLEHSFHFNNTVAWNVI